MSQIIVSDSFRAAALIKSLENCRRTAIRMLELTDEGDCPEQVKDSLIKNVDLIDNMLAEINGLIKVTGPDLGDDFLDEAEKAIKPLIDFMLAMKRMLDINDSF